MVTGKFLQTSKSLKMLLPRLPENISFTFYIFINSSSCSKQYFFLTGIYFVFVKNVIEQTSKALNSWTSVKKSGKKLSNKTNFSTFLQTSCSNFRLNFRLKLYSRPQIYQNYQTNHVWRGLGWIKSKILFPETILAKVFQTNSSFHVK